MLFRSMGRLPGTVPPGGIRKRVGNRTSQLVPVLALLLAFAAPTPSSDGDKFATLIRRAEILRMKGHYPEAERTLRSALDESNRFAPGDPRLGVLHNILASVYFGLGRDADAEKHYRLAIEIMEKAGREHESYLIRFVCNLAKLHIVTGEYEKVADLHLDSWVKRLESTQPHDILLAELLSTLGKWNARLERHEQAEIQTVRALAIWEKVEPDGVNLMDTLNDLGNLFAAMRRNTEAIASYERAVRLVETRLGSDHPHLANLFTNVGVLHLKSKSPAEAVSFLERASAIAESRLGPVHPLVGRILSIYAIALHQTGRRREAKKYHERARTILQNEIEGDPRRHTIDFSEILRNSRRR